MGKEGSIERQSLTHAQHQMSPTFFPFASTVTTPGTSAAANASRPASRSVMATSEAPKAFAAKSVTSPIGPAPVMSTRCPGRKPAFVHA